MARAAICAAIAVMAVAQRASGAACPPGVTQPSVTTLVASTASSERDAWIVKPDCTYSSVSLSSGELALVGFELDRIDSVPTETVEVLIGSERLARGADFSRATKLQSVQIASFGAGLVENLKLPSTLTVLGLGDGPADSLDKLRLPDSIQRLIFIGLGMSSLKSLKSLPSSLVELELHANAFSDINFPIPSTVQRLVMDRNPLFKLERVTLSDSLTSFSCDDCAIVKVRGVKWPSKLTNLNLKNNAIREFELRQSDFDVLSKLANIDFRLLLDTCSEKEATVQQLRGQSVCVISDDRFETLYSGDMQTSSSTSSGKDTDSASAAEDDSTASGGSDENNNNNNINNSTSSRTGSNERGGNMAVGSDGQPLNGENPSGGTKETIVVNTPSSPISSTVIGILIAVSSVFGIVFAFISYRHYRSSQRTGEKAAASTIMTYETPKATRNEDPASSNSNGGSSQEYLSNDIRNDKTIIPYRIDQKEITLSKQIARGGFGVIFRGVYSGRAVAIKQMLPDAWRNETQLINFMDEIRLCASLSHPKIVEFIGVAWTSLRDISVIIEYMDGGDLHAVLRKHAQGQSLSSSTTSFPSSDSAASSSSSDAFVSSPREWSEPWTNASINSKTSIARDVAEAVVYLHSFSNPIVHRDLKAHNVLLDTRGNAKLSDFGISRAITVDETMTSEVGTSAWIAPEVLRGDRYSERADIYSFGVLLVELDKCRHPYAGEESLGLMGCGPIGLVGKQHDARDSQSQAMHQNMQIAMLVSAGRLRPKPSAPCPDRIQALISRCLSFAPEDRPSAMEAHYELRQILAGR